MEHGASSDEFFVARLAESQPYIHTHNVTRERISIFLLEKDHISYFFCS